MKTPSVRGITYVVVALAAVIAIRTMPIVPERRPVEVLQQSEGFASQVASRRVSRVERLNRGETLIGLLRRTGITDQAAQEVVRAASASAVDARFLRAGMPVDVVADSAEAESPSELVLHLGIDRLLHMRRGPDGWTGTEEKLPWTRDTVVVAGTITANLYQAMNDGATEFFPGHATDELAWALADIFEYRVDMSRDLQQGDQFHALVERERGPQGVTRIGTVLAAKFTLSGTEVSAVRFGGSDQHPRYYDANGKSLRAQFLRAPLEFRRISSTFGTRFHPILGRWKAHKGTDYAANPGTPVRAIGDAVVIKAGWGGGYGNVLELRHRNGYVTRYGHLRGFATGVRAGTRVEIGQTVAYVGTTGLSTGPHLHFEVLLDGVQRDSRTALRTTAGEPLDSGERSQFNAQRERLLASLSGTQGVVRLALR